MTNSWQKPGTLDSGQLQADPLQHSVVGKLQGLYDRLMAAENMPRSPQKQGGFFHRFFQKSEVPSEEQLVEGLYLWGGVGRGKTLLCDMFYAGLPLDKKKRVHFHRFMQGVHDQLKVIKGEELLMPC